MTSSLSRFSTSDERLTPVFAVRLSAVARSSDTLPTTDKAGCRIVGTLSENAPTSDKYAGKQGSKPLSEAVVGGARKQ